MAQSLSIVIPVFNEVDSLPELHRELSEVLAESNDYEIIYVDDGSTDGTTEVLIDLAAGDGSVKMVQLQRNYGKSAALSEGFKLAAGQAVVTMDGDLQDDPREILRLVKKLEEGYDLISGWKKERRDPASKRWPSKFFNLVTRLMTGVRIHDFNCGLKIYRLAVIKKLDIYGGRHRYIPALAGQQRFRIGELVVNHRPRTHGQSKYGGARFFHGFFDLITILFLNRYTQQPLHLFGLIGLTSFSLGFLVELYVLYLKYVLGEPFQKHLALLVFGVMIIVIGIQFFSLGLLGEMIARSQQRHEDRVKRILP